MHATFSVSPGDLPAWARDILREHDMRPSHVTVVASADPSVGGSWHDANRTTLYAWDGSRVRSFSGTFGGMNPWASNAENAVNAGFTTHLPDARAMVLELTSYPRSARLYVHPDAAPNMLPAPDDAITWEMRVVLVAARSLKSSYAGIPNLWRHEAQHSAGCGPAAYDEARAACIARGLLNKAGAITPAGRNVAGTKDLDQLARERPTRAE